MRRRTRRRLQAAALIAGAAALLRSYRPDLGPGLAPVIAYVHSGAWHGPLALVVALVASWLAWRIRPARRPGGRPEATALYRWYDVEARLLYVGISNQPVRRTGQHDDHQPWWREVRSATVEWLPTRAEALEAEERAIKREHPEHNVVHNGRRAAQWVR